MEGGVLAARARWITGLQTEARDEWGGHTLICDEPESIGGTNTGPSPFSLLQMALANCSATTILRVAKDEKIPITGLEVRVFHKQNRLDETATSHYTVTCDLRMTELRRRIVVEGELSEEQLKLLLWGVEHCPVSNSIEKAIPIKTDLRLGAPS